MFLITILHFHYNMLPLIRSTIYIIYDTTHILCLGQLLFVLEGDIRYNVLTFKEIIEETNQQIFSNFLPKDQFKSPIRKWIDKLSHTLSNLFCKYKKNI